MNMSTALSTARDTHDFNCYTLLLILYVMQSPDLAGLFPIIFVDVNQFFLLALSWPNDQFSELVSNDRQRGQMRTAPKQVLAFGQ